MKTSKSFPYTHTLIYSYSKFPLSYGDYLVTSCTWINNSLQYHNPNQPSYYKFPNQLAHICHLETQYRGKTIRNDPLHRQATHTIPGNSAFHGLMVIFMNHFDSTESFVVV